MSSEPGGAYPFPVFSVALPRKPGNPISETFVSGSPDASPLTRHGGITPEQYLGNMQRRVEEIEKEAYEKAFLLGEKAGKELGEAAVASMIDKLTALSEEIAGLRGTILRESERELVELAFQIARAVVGSEVETRQDIVLENARRAIQRIGSQGRITLRVHPNDADTVWKKRESLTPFLSGKGDIVVEPDDDVGRGGCLAVTDFSEADATIDGQFEVLSAHLKAVREDHA